MATGAGHLRCGDRRADQPALAAPAGWGWFYRVSAERGADWGSIWYFFQVRHWPVIGTLTTSGLNLASAIALCLLSGLEPEKRADRLRVFIHAEALRPFDLARGPLLRAGLIRLGQRVLFRSLA